MEGQIVTRRAKLSVKSTPEIKFYGDDDKRILQKKSWVQFGVQVILVFFCFLAFYGVVFIFSVPILLFLGCRYVLSWLLIWIYQGRYQIIAPYDGAFALDRPGNVTMINYFFYIRGPCDIVELRHRFESTFMKFQEKDGKRPYEKMLCAVVRKWGFLCWENKRATFDITRHVRVCPGAGDPNKVYTETEMFSAVAHLADDLWAEGEPRWEVLVVPRMTRDGNEDVAEYSALCVKLHHVYGDGISVAQICRLVLLDKPVLPLSIDPVNPPIPPIPWYMTVLWYLQAVVVGPYTIFNLMPDKNQHVFNMAPLKGPKYFGRSQTTIPISKMRRIRQQLGCCSSAIQHSAFQGAMQTMALRKGLSLPAQVRMGITVAKLPFPDVYPQNCIYLIMDFFPAGILDPLKRLRAVDHFYKKLATCMHKQITAQVALQVIGVLPIVIADKLFQLIQCNYVVSNVIGMDGNGNINGSPITDAFGTGPAVSGIGFTLGTGLYQSNFSFGFQVERSSVIECKEDLEAFIRQFEREIEYLDAVCAMPSDRRA